MPRAPAIFRLFCQFRHNRSGATAIEYAIIAGGIALVIIAAVAALGSKTLDNFEAAVNAFS